ncbi:MAG: MATE family efflux transporter [Lachnospiraceae bacterium]|nr:MATE family efflux transporter [Lachnospiraceae bacterium]
MQPNSEAQYQKMTETPIPKLVLTLAVPTIISMLVTAIYNMADTFFVSQLGTSASGAVGIVFSLMAIIQAVGFTLGMGAGSLVSRLLGSREPEKARRIAASAFYSAIAFGLLLTVFGLIFLDPLMGLLGATPTILPYARDYARYILLGAAIMASSFVMNNLLRAEGKAAFSMIGLTLGGLLNIALDPLFIFVFDLGIAGAAIATVISQAVSFLILLSFFLCGKSTTSLSIRYLSKDRKDYFAVVKTGLPSFSRQGLASIATVALNNNAAVYGDAAVAAMSIVGRIFMFVLSVMLGIGQGFQPVAGFNYGAGRYDRVRKSFWFTSLSGFVMMSVLSIAGFIAAPELIALFRRGDAEVIHIGTLAARLQFLAMPLQALSVPTNMLMQSIGKSFQATFLSCLRQGIFFLPLILILPQYFELLGVQMTQPISDLLTFLVCIPFLFVFFRNLGKAERAQK